MTIGEANAIEIRIYNLHFPREEGMLCHAGPHRETSGLVRKQNQEKGESVSQGPYCGFQGNGEAGQHKQLWIGQFENFQWI